MSDRRDWAYSLLGSGTLTDIPSLAFGSEALLHLGQIYFSDAAVPGCLIDLDGMKRPLELCDSFDAGLLDSASYAALA